MALVGHGIAGGASVLLAFFIYTLVAGPWGIFDVQVKVGVR